MNLDDIKKLSLEDLRRFCGDLQLNVNGNRINLIYEILKKKAFQGEKIITSGYLELINNYGFLRDIKNNFSQTLYDIYISPRFIKDCDLRMGDLIKCEISPPKNDDQKFFSATYILSVNDREVNFVRRSFEDLTPIYPKEQIILERSDVCDKHYNTIGRLLDLIATIGFGQRVLIAAPPKTGKTTFLHAIAQAIETNYPDKPLLIALVDERPEEVIEMKKIVPKATVLASTFDEPAENHIRVAEMLNEMAKRLAEFGNDVIILIDSITRLARACNMVVPSSGKILSGGVEPAAMYKPKRFLGSARNFVEGGSVTVISTGLIETGSRMDEYIREELKGTGNCDIVLNRNISNAQIFPAIDINASGTRRVENMLDAKNCQYINILKQFLSGMETKDAIKFIIDQIQNSSNNKELLVRMNKNAK